MLAWPSRGVSVASIAGLASAGALFALVAAACGTSAPDDDGSSNDASVHGDGGGSPGSCGAGPAPGTDGAGPGTDGGGPGHDGAGPIVGDGAALPDVAIIPGAGCG